VIIAPYYNVTTGNLSVWVTSDLWEAVSGTVTFTWMDWSGKELSTNLTKSVDFEVGAINSTQVLQTFTTESLADYDLTNVVLHMTVEADGSLPVGINLLTSQWDYELILTSQNTNETLTFRHDNWFHPTALRDAQLVDPGLSLTYSNSTKNFTVAASTGVAAWVWLDYGSGAVVAFDSNAFWLEPGQPREVGYKVKSDSTGGGWIGTVSALMRYGVLAIDR